jgi:DNA-directed RNA polymerase specialized sigma subunit
MTNAPEERARLFDAYRRTGERRVRDQLIEMNVGLAEAVARRFAGRGERHDDLLQVALVGVVRSSTATARSTRGSSTSSSA